jgi:polygalacturonase
MMNRRRLLSSAVSTLGAAALVAPAHAGVEPMLGRVWDVHDFHARGDGKTLDTVAIQAAIDACTQAGGGVVFFPAGSFLSGTLTLKDGVTLYFSPSASLIGSVNLGDYPAKPFPARDLDVGGFEIWALIYAQGMKNIGIAGPGTIDGNGKTFPPRHPPNLDVSTGGRPRLLFFKECQNVRVRDITLRNSTCWTAHFAMCDHVIVDGIRVFSNYFVNQDGILLDSCQDSFISDCYADTSDDALVIKASFPRQCKNLAITNCVLTTTCAAIKFGTQSLGGFQNISISNCACYECPLGGLKFLTVDGGDLEDVVVSNITMHNVSAPITFVLGNRAQDFGFSEVERPRPIARLRNVLVSGVRATVASRNDRWRKGNTCLIAGLPGHPVEGVVIENISITYPGGGTLEEARRSDVPEREQAYPENTMFGVLPGYGFYVRHARGLTLRNVSLQLDKPDLRPALVGDDIEDLELTGSQAPMSGSEPLIRLHDTRRALIQNSRPLNDVEIFLQVGGAASADIGLMANDLRRARNAIARTGGFSGNITQAGNMSLESA